MSPEDLFGSALPAGYNPATKLPPSRGIPSGRERQRSIGDAVRDISEFGTPEEGRGKRRKSQVDHNARTQKWFESRGYFYVRVDGWMMKSGMAVKKDFMGLWDAEATKPGTRILIQICSKADRSKHIQKLCGDDPAPDNKLPRIQNLRHCLSIGVRCLLVMWEQGDNGRWHETIEQVTEETIQQAISRRRRK